MNANLPNGPLPPRCSGLFALQPNVVYPRLRHLAPKHLTVQGDLLGSARVDAKSQSQTQLPSRSNRVAVSVRRADHDRVTHQQFSLSSVRLALSHLALEAVASFPASSCMCFPMVLLAVLCWLIRKTFAGCAAYAGRLYIIPLSVKATRMLGALYPLHHVAPRESSKPDAKNAHDRKAVHLLPLPACCDGSRTASARIKIRSGEQA